MGPREITRECSRIPMPCYSFHLNSSGISCVGPLQWRAFGQASTNTVVKPGLAMSVQPPYLPGWCRVQTQPREGPLKTTLFHEAQGLWLAVCTQVKGHSAVKGGSCGKWLRAASVTSAWITVCFAAQLSPLQVLPFSFSLFSCWCPFQKADVWSSLTYSILCLYHWPEFKWPPEAKFNLAGPNSTWQGTRQITLMGGRSLVARVIQSRSVS